MPKNVSINDLQKTVHIPPLDRNQSINRPVPNLFSRLQGTYFAAFRAALPVLFSNKQHVSESGNLHALPRFFNKPRVACSETLGRHTCQDVYCLTCDTAVGWEYVRAESRAALPESVYFCVDVCIYHVYADAAGTC